MKTKYHKLTTTTFIPESLERVFAFFSQAENLGKITPQWLKFQLVSPVPEMEVGARFEYKLTIHYLPVRWLTEISAWEPPLRFLDRQIKGPYREWIHEHRFESTDSGTLMTDTVHYRLPLGWLGSLAHWWFVRRDVENIFHYRNEVILQLFGETERRND